MRREVKRRRMPEGEPTEILYRPDGTVLARIYGGTARDFYERLARAIEGPGCERVPLEEGEEKEDECSETEPRAVGGGPTR